ncbi:response regulator [Variovorax sp. E3]|uniref:response regulator n=1 Tax=Variovorax sp. E3 TaxID=1914993 RepID=UPI0018DCE9F4|nr:response regulator [Variovorax sp. E3]
MAIITFLVEDSATIRDNLIPTLADLANARVIGFADGEQEATQWLTSHGGTWDLAVVDLFLKEGSGLGVLKGCRNRLPSQRVIILSNYATDDVRRQCLALGADAVFDKSTELEGLFEFCAKVNNARSEGR